MHQIKYVFLIDDENIFNFINKEIIKMGEFAQKVSSYCNANKALEELRELQKSGKNGFPEVIFLDINMPSMDGWEFMEEFEKFPKEMLNKCNVYMLTSSIDPTEIERSKSFSSLKDFITKPLTAEILKTIAV